MHPDDELSSLRRLLDALESGWMKLLLNGRDVTQEEVAKLKPDIEYLEICPGANPQHWKEPCVKASTISCVARGVVPAAAFKTTYDTLGERNGSLARPSLPR
jgi:hypothetical protein